MRRLLIVASILFLLAISVIGQGPSAKLTPTEEREAKAFAVAFFNRYQKTQDVAPLLKEYFVTDFARRLTFCRTTRECEGTDRDFWTAEEEPAPYKPTKEDFVRQYASQINYFAVYLESVRVLALSSGKKPDDYEDEAGKIIDARLGLLLKDNPEVLALSFFGEGSDTLPRKLKSIGEFRQQLSNFEKLVRVLRAVQAGIKQESKNRPARARLTFTPKMFRPNREINSGRFFDYHAGTEMIQIWSEELEVPFIMDLVRVKGKLKIVAIYPPMD